MSERRHRTSRSKQAGYTLVDVMVVTLIIGILATVAVNRYQRYVAHAKRPEAVMAFRALAAKQREHLVTRGRYAGTFDELGFQVEAGHRVSPTEIQGRLYNYRLIQDDGPRSWYCIASGNIDGDPFVDILAATNPR